MTFGSVLDHGLFMFVSVFDPTVSVNFLSLLQEPFVLENLLGGQPSLIALDLKESRTLLFNHLFSFFLFLV